MDSVRHVGGGISSGPLDTVVLFGLLSFWALREFITLTPTRPGDHRTLFWVFFLVTPLQFWLVGMGYYGWYSILIPVYAFLLIPARIAMAGDYKRFLERTAKIQCGLLICVYCLSYAPALLTLKMPDQDAGGGAAAAVLLRADRAAQRRLSIRLVAASQQARDRARDQHHANVGRAAGRHGQRHAGRRRCCGGPRPSAAPTGGCRPSCRR